MSRTVQDNWKITYFHTGIFAIWGVIISVFYLLMSIFTLNALLKIDKHKLSKRVQEHINHSIIFAGTNIAMHGLLISAAIIFLINAMILLFKEGTLFHTHENGDVTIDTTSIFEPVGKYTRITFAFFWLFIICSIISMIFNIIVVNNYSHMVDMNHSGTGGPVLREESSEIMHTVKHGAYLISSGPKWSLAVSSISLILLIMFGNPNNQEE